MPLPLPLQAHFDSFLVSTKGRLLPRDLPCDDDPAASCRCYVVSNVASLARPKALSHTQVWELRSTRICDRGLVGLVSPATGKVSARARLLACDGPVRLDSLRDAAPDQVLVVDQRTASTPPCDAFLGTTTTPPLPCHYAFLWKFSDVKAVFSHTPHRSPHSSCRSIL